VLISAYACGPVEEPEASAGWAFAVAAAQHADVWVITRRRFSAAVSAALAQDPALAEHLQVVHIDLPDSIRKFWKHDWDLYWYYFLWQRELSRTARRLHAEFRFDVAHHVTFANDWLPCGLAHLNGVPFVWGPVGGASRIPYWRLRSWLGFRGLSTELIRSVITAVPREIWGDRAARKADLVVAQNQDVADHFTRFAATIVEPNAALDPVPMLAPPPEREGGQPVAVYAGRLIGLKGVRLALDALARPEVQDWRLRIYGDGYDRQLLVGRARKLGIADRVDFLGHRPRAEVLAAFERADAMLFPSMHDQAGWAAAEASSLGCPVVCLPLGGPPLLARPNAFVAGLEGDIVGNVAAQLKAAGRSRGERHNRWSAERLPALVASWYDRVAPPAAG
jgi:glycosyltransferase involved in cell wall biosynthesis